MLTHAFQLKAFAIQLAGYLKLGINRAIRGLFEESARRLETSFQSGSKAKESAADLLTPNDSLVSAKPGEIGERSLLYLATVRLQGKEETIRIQRLQT